MSTPSYLGEPRLVRLGKFLAEIRNGELYVPRFQRPFVWTDEQRLALLQSIYLGYPIGSILVWRTQKWRLKTYDNLGPVKLPAQDLDSQTVRQYLLDGHQRMTTLFASLGPGLYEGENLSEAWDDETEIRWPIYFDLLAAEKSSNPFRLKRQREVAPATWVGLDILLDSFALGDFKDDLRTKAKASRELVNRVQTVADTMRDYTIPVIPMATEDLEQVTTGFKRVNSGGSKMSEVHMVNALTWSSEFDLLERLDEIKRELESDGWGDFNAQMIMNVCKARFELDIYRTSAEELAKGIKDQPKVLDDALAAIIRAGGLLREIAGVHGPAALPYSYQAVLLADALHTGPKLTKGVKAKLRRWFWLTTLTEYFQGMTGSLFTRAQKHLRRLVKNKVQAKPPELPEYISPLLGFDYRATRSRAMALLLAELEPQLPTGEPFDASALLAEHGNNALPRLISNRQLPKRQRARARGAENRFLLPSRASKQLLEALQEGDELSFELARSHAISEPALAHLIEGDFSAFLHARRINLLELEKTRAEEIGLTYEDTTSLLG